MKVSFAQGLGMNWCMFTSYECPPSHGLISLCLCVILYAEALEIISQVATHVNETIRQMVRLVYLQ